MTNEARVRRERLQALMKTYGYESIRKLCKEAKVEAGNLYSNLYGKYDISIKRSFKLANVLGCDVIEVIKVFHPELYSENQRIVAEKHPVEAE